MKEGRWRVFTKTACYDIDLDNMLCRRSLKVEPPKDWIQSKLRKDDDVVILHDLMLCEVGQRMQMIIQVRDDSITTYRQTTPVEEIIDVTLTMS